VKKEFILIKKLETEGLQTRAALNMDVVREYAEAERDGKAVFPPLTVFHGKDGRLRVADGFHRLAAARQNGREKVACEVQSGEFQDALKYALLANQAHGLRRTTEDKAKAIRMAYENRKALNLPDDVSARVIGDMVGVRHETAAIHLAKFASWKDRTTTTGSDNVTRALPPPPVRPRPQDAPQPPPTRPPERPAVTIHDEAHRDATPPPERPRKAAPVACQQDQLGKDVPPGLAEMWNRRGELAAVAELVSKARCAIQAAQDGNDPLFGELNFSSVLSHLNLAFREVSSAVPYCVCPMCQGIGCKACKDRGLMGKYRYDQVVPSSMKGG
jgi:hypothetical protein